MFVFIDKFPVIQTRIFKIREVRCEVYSYFKKKRRDSYSPLTFIERPGQEDCRQNQEDHVPREPVPHPREVPSPPEKESRPINAAAFD